MCEARSRQFEEKTKMFTERSEPIMLIAYWYLCFPVSWALCFTIRCRFLVSRRSASSPLAFFMIPLLALCLCFLFWSCLLFTLIPSTISHLWNQPCRARRCLRQYADAALTLLRSFIKCDRSAHIYVLVNPPFFTVCVPIKCLLVCFIVLLPLKKTTAVWLKRRQVLC